MKLIRVRKSPVTEPELFVKALGIDNERLPFPLSDRPAVVKRVIVIAAQLAFLSATIRIDDPVIAISAADEHKDALAVAVFIELDSIRQLVLPGAARRHAIQVQGIVLQQIALS